MSAVRKGSGLVSRGCASMVLLLWLAPSWPAMAADTLETWGKGDADVEYYVEGGAGGGDGHVASSLVLGYGLEERFSAYLALTMEGDGHLGEGAGDLAMGIFGTPLDTDHLDLDLLLDTHLSGPGFTEFSLCPGVELNLDAKPELEAWGVYLRMGHVFKGVAAQEGATETEYHAEAVAGYYWTLGQGRQVLVEAGVELQEDFGGVSQGAIAIGYNHVLSPELELITEVHVDLEPEGSLGGHGVMLGVVGTLPK